MTAQTRQMIASLLVALAIVALVVVAVTIKLGPTSAAERELREERLEQQEELREEELERQEDRREGRGARIVDNLVAIRQPPVHQPHRRGR
jgi:hypothetical protein